MIHSSATGWTCPECHTKYDYAIDCILRETLPECCKKYFKLIDHIHLYKKEFEDWGTIRYKLDDYGNYRIIIEVDNWDDSIKCLCEVKERLKEINYD